MEPEKWVGPEKLVAPWTQVQRLGRPVVQARLAERAKRVEASGGEIWDLAEWGPGALGRVVQASADQATDQGRPVLANNKTWARFVIILKNAVR